MILFFCFSKVCVVATLNLSQEMSDKMNNISRQFNFTQLRKNRAKFIIFDVFLKFCTFTLDENFQNVRKMTKNGQFWTYCQAQLASSVELSLALILIITVNPHPPTPGKVYLSP